MFMALCVTLAVCDLLGVAGLRFQLAIHGLEMTSIVRAESLHDDDHDNEQQHSDGGVGSMVFLLRDGRIRHVIVVKTVLSLSRIALHSFLRSSFGGISNNAGARQYLLLQEIYRSRFDGKDIFRAEPSNRFDKAPRRRPIESIPGTQYSGEGTGLNHSLLL